MNDLTIPFVVEGYPDEMAIRRLAKYTGIKLEKCYRMGSKQSIMKNISSFNERARFCPMIVLVDLNSNYNCAPELKMKWLPKPSQYICFRVAVREIEAWLLEC